MTHLFTRDYHKAGAWPLKTNRYSLSHSVVVVWLLGRRRTRTLPPGVNREVELVSLIYLESIYLFVIAPH